MKQATATPQQQRSSDSNPITHQQVQYLKGVGPHKAELLKKLGVHVVEDLVLYFPRTHQDRRLIKIKDANPGHKASFLVEVLSIEFRRVGKQLGQARALVKDSSGIIEAIWFKFISYKYDAFLTLKRDVIPGKKIILYGLVEWLGSKQTLRVEDMEIVDPSENQGVHANRIVPIYPLTQGLQDRWLRQLIFRLVPNQRKFLTDPLPEAIRSKHKLPNFTDAVQWYHIPNSWEQRDKARERLAFDEFFFLELALALSRTNRQNQTKGFQSFPTRQLLTSFKNQLGFQFTPSQMKVINEIFKDMGQSTAMYRLLQGDVGSGKTVVALSAALLAIENGRQAALLSPTEILAEQHFLSIEKFFRNLPVRFALLTRSTSVIQRKKIIANLAQGKLDLIIGTHAILNEDVQFKKLGLVIIDEQHRFGVRQRAKLVAKANSSKSFQEGILLSHLHPDVLIMTATPIPRTLALTLYGDLDVSIIDELPKGRAPIQTLCVNEDTALSQIKKTVGQGQQAFVVFPLIDESEKMSRKSGILLKAAKKELERLKNLLPGLKLDILHGQMPADQKRDIMANYRNGHVSVLVSTPVIEVGIDVPNATTMVIVNPERYGLAQLHQLRGRVGRGDIPSQCLLVTDELPEKSHGRLESFCFTLNGFRLAEDDLKLRGPGEFLGEAQHGIPFFRVGDLIRDGFIIHKAREAAQEISQSHLPITMKEFSHLNHELQKRFGRNIQLSRVG